MIAYLRFVLLELINAGQVMTVNKTESTDRELKEMTAHEME
jgi:hypothetical protein